MRRPIAPKGQAQTDPRPPLGSSPGVTEFSQAAAAFAFSR